MKRLILLALCAFGFLSLNAQDRYFVYGVDYSVAKVYGAEESASDFKDAFIGINKLLVDEAKKYDFSKVVGTRVFVKVDPMIRKLSNIRFSNLISGNPYYDNINYSSIINRYKLAETKGVGVVMIAKILNKKDNEGVYQLILFDIASRKILAQKEVKGKPKGFGLRNFWAGSVYDAIKKTKI